MYRKILEEVGIMMTRAMVKQEIANRQAELEGIVEELRWMPNLLNGQPNDHTLLMFYITVQHDIAMVSYKIRNREFGTAEQGSLRDEWILAMRPLAEILMLLQSYLIREIGRNPLVNNREAAEARVEELLYKGTNSWATWSSDNLPKIHEFYLRTLDWRITSKWVQGPNSQVYDWFSHSRSCSLASGWENACEAKKCDGASSCFGKYDKSQCDPKLCGEDEMKDYVDKLYKEKVLSFDDTLDELKELKGIGPTTTPRPTTTTTTSTFTRTTTTTTPALTLFSSLGGGRCKDGSYPDPDPDPDHGSGTTKKLSTTLTAEDCARSCVSHANNQCRYFAWRPDKPDKGCRFYGASGCNLDKDKKKYVTYKREVLSEEQGDP
ncbi:unnamed protein product [Symbiodinium natans]|uniref:Apple domain-containing protein n=1 Tax=Symbiodinium natans TaxID=878477 RepID=A0A812H8G8_9DINO|nr:unnamed protein product [Symbiodinium natans]